MSNGFVAAATKPTRCTCKRIELENESTTLAQRSKPGLERGEGNEPWLSLARSRLLPDRVFVRDQTPTNKLHLFVLSISVFFVCVVFFFLSSVGTFESEPET